LAKKIGDISTVGFNRTCSNERSGENKCSNGKPLTKSRVSLKKPIYHECGQEDE